MTAPARRSVLEALDRYELPLLRYAQRLLSDEGLARDAVQHAFLQLCRQSPPIDSEKTGAWLYTVCRNKALDQRRRQGRNETLAEAQTLPSADPDPSQAAEQAELGQRLQKYLDQLPTAQREALHLWSSGCSYREIAQITSRREASIRVLVHRALVRLRQHPSVQNLLCEPASQEFPS
ncbi:RNA polymerase sigma factor [Lignipirellula cremea]|uniref:RNA polymerase sigma factor SigM n=1 Tax=Lignipirellula cremea TaxID=2528010 RepID=A0A518DLJ5_9BACT|nr:sigma-70 family RNA polymerase sigma factor [Lignipirellula cremea]QDU92692.1 RNA polymerase sigma factor SigM [Lignipirellula cremea]